MVWSPKHCCWMSSQRLKEYFAHVEFLHLLICIFPISVVTNIHQWMENEFVISRAVSLSVSENLTKKGQFFQTRLPLVSPISREYLALWRLTKISPLSALGMDPCPEFFNPVLYRPLWVWSNCKIQVAHSAMGKAASDGYSFPEKIRHLVRQS